MKLLLDTHAFIWADAEPQKLSASAKAACEDPTNQLILSTVSVWEMQIKMGLGKLTLRAPIRLLLEDWIQQSGLTILPVNLEHVLHLSNLPSHHKDPFDRMLVAQALAEGWEIVSHDSAFRQYPVKVIW